MKNTIIFLFILATTLIITIIQSNDDVIIHSLIAGVLIGWIVMIFVYESAKHHSKTH